MPKPEIDANNKKHANKKNMNLLKRKKLMLLAFAVLLVALIATLSVVEYRRRNLPVNPRIRVEMENGGVFVLELYPGYAPVTVRNFISLVERGFYDGLTFHRIIDRFMAQGGCPEGTGMGNSGSTIRGEFRNNGFTRNTLRHTAGVISMARGPSPNSASSQFFIVLGNSPHLKGDYAAFGRVIEGMDVVEAFQTVERTYNAGGELSQPV